MKAMIDNANGKLANIIPDNAKEFTGHTYIKIESLEVDLKEVKTFEDGVYKLYMEGGTLKAYTQEELEAQPEYIRKKRLERKAKYEDLDNGSDALLYDFLEELAPSYPAGQAWLARKAEIKGQS